MLASIEDKMRDYLCVAGRRACEKELK